MKLSKIFNPQDKKQKNCGASVIPSVDDTELECDRFIDSDCVAFFNGISEFEGETQRDFNFFIHNKSKKIAYEVAKKNDVSRLDIYTLSRNIITSNELPKVIGGRVMIVVDKSLKPNISVDFDLVGGEFIANEPNYFVFTCLNYNPNNISENKYVLEIKNIKEY